MIKTHTKERKEMSLCITKKHDSLYPPSSTQLGLVGGVIIPRERRWSFFFSFFSFRQVKWFGQFLLPLWVDVLSDHYGTVSPTTSFAVSISPGKRRQTYMRYRSVDTALATLITIPFLRLKVCFNFQRTPCFICVSSHWLGESVVYGEESKI